VLPSGRNLARHRRTVNLAQEVNTGYLGYLIPALGTGNERRTFKDLVRKRAHAGFVNSALAVPLDVQPFEKTVTSACTNVKFGLEMAAI